MPEVISLSADGAFGLFAFGLMGVPLRRLLMIAGLCGLFDQIGWLAGTAIYSAPAQMELWSGILLIISIVLPLSRKYFTWIFPLIASIDNLAAGIGHAPSSEEAILILATSFAMAGIGALAGTAIRQAAIQPCNSKQGF